jgi:hypothetical protein
MAVTMLMIGQMEKVNIAAAIERARRHPVPLDLVRAGALEDKPVIKLRDRKPGFDYHARKKPEEVLIPFGFRAAVSFEDQPAGMCLHLSISAERADPKLVPTVPSLIMIAREFGIDFEAAQEQGLVWLEEYEPGRHAVNLVKVVAPRQEGHA